MTTSKRRRKSPAARLRPFWIAILVLAVAAIATVCYAATWPGFYPRTVTVSGNRLVPTAEILSRAQIAPHENVWLQNVRADAARIETIPYVNSARVRRSLPASVRIAVTERLPFAILEGRGTRVLVDRDLRVLGQPNVGGSLPLIVSKNARVPPPGGFVRDGKVRRLCDDYGALTRAHVAARSLDYDRFGDLVAVTRSNIRLLLGEDADLSKKTPLIDPIISQISATGKKLAAVDLRAPGTPVVVYKH